MSALHLHYTLNAILIPHINHYYQALCLALYWEVSLRCSSLLCDNRGEISRTPAVYRSRMTSDISGNP